MYNHRYVSKVYLYSHDIYKGSMHNKRFIILNQVCSRVLFFVWQWNTARCWWKLNTEKWQTEFPITTFLFINHRNGELLWYSIHFLKYYWSEKKKKKIWRFLRFCKWTFFTIFWWFTDFQLIIRWKVCWLSTNMTYMLENHFHRCTQHPLKSRLKYGWFKSWRPKLILWWWVSFDSFLSSYGMKYILFCLFCQLTETCAKLETRMNPSFFISSGQLLVSLLSPFPFSVSLKMRKHVSKAFRRQKSTSSHARSQDLDVKGILLLSGLYFFVTSEFNSAAKCHRTVCVRSKI